MKLTKIFLIFIFLALVSNAQSPTALSYEGLSGPEYYQFKAIRPREIFGVRGNFDLCGTGIRGSRVMPCVACANKKFQRMYLRYHLGGAHGRVK